MLQLLAGMLKLREVPPASFGPPNGPTGLRVSRTRHGVTGTNWSGDVNGATVCVNGREVLPRNSAWPAYTAIMEWLPRDSADVVNAACPLLSVPSPSMEEPSKKLTVPVGVPPFEATVAMNVTDWPNVEGFTEEVTEMEGVDAVTITPWPVNDTACGEALSSIIIVALRLPTNVGVKVTLMLQLAPAAKLVPQLLFSAKSPAFAPVSVILLMVSGIFPELESTTSCGELVVPIRWTAKL